MSEKLPGLLRYLWWSLRGRCLKCGAPRRTDVPTTRCHAHHGAMYRRCARCETWHPDNEDCPKALPPPSADGPWTRAVEETRRR